MAVIDSHPLDERHLIRELVGEIEAIREKRKAQWRDTPHPERKRFTQGELRDLARSRLLLLGPVPGQDGHADTGVAINLDAYRPLLV